MSALLAAAVVFGAVLTAPIASVADTGGKIVFGLYPGPRGGRTNQQVLTSLESQAGHTFGGVRVFDMWDQQFPSSYDRWLRDAGHTLYLSVKSKRQNGSVVLWRDVANATVGSSLYNDIVRWATAVRDFGAPIYFTFNHEPEASASSRNGTSSEFIAAWRRVVTIFREQGVTNARYAWIMTDYAFWRTDRGRADLWYPGDAYVDAVGIDAYNWSNCRSGVTNPWWTLEWIADHLRVWGINHPNEELMLTEWASHEDPNVSGRKATWINQAQALFQKPGWEQFTTVLYFHNAQPSTCNFWIDSTASSLSAWLAMSNDPFYSRRLSSTDQVPPTVPGRPTGISAAPGTIDLTWPASTDDQATTLVYQVYRDGGALPVGSVTSSSTTTVSYRDGGLNPGSAHTYQVAASDGTNASARSPASDPIAVQGSSAIFSDGFDTGFANWTGVTNMTVDQATGSPAAPSARVQTNASRAWAYKILGGSYATVCASARVNLTSTTDGAGLIRLRTATDGPIVRALVSSSRALAIRSDFSGAQRYSSSGALPLGSWTLIELCGSVGTSGTWSLYRNGTLLLGPWTANTGSTPVGRITIGTPDVHTITVNFDDVTVDTVPG